MMEYTLFEIEKYFKANLAIWIILLISVNILNLWGMMLKLAY